MKVEEFAIRVVDEIAHTQVLRALWSDRFDTYELVVVEVETDDTTSLLQVLATRAESELVLLGISEVGHWLPVANRLGVVSRVDALEPGAVAVEVDVDGNLRVLDTHGGYACLALWMVTENEPWNWPEFVKLHINGSTVEPAFKTVPRSVDSLVDSYLNWVREPNDTDYWAYWSVEWSVEHDPRRAWEILVHILASASADLVESVGAGFVEDLLRRHAVELIDAIEEAAATHKAVRDAINAAWFETDDPVLEARLILACESD